MTITTLPAGCLPRAEISTAILSATTMTKLPSGTAVPWAGRFISTASHTQDTTRMTATIPWCSAAQATTLRTFRFPVATDSKRLQTSCSIMSISNAATAYRPSGISRQKMVIQPTIRTAWSVSPRLIVLETILCVNSLIQSVTACNKTKMNMEPLPIFTNLEIIMSKTTIPSS